MDFSLNQQEARLMFCYQAYLMNIDILVTIDTQEREVKRLWFSAWTVATEEFLSQKQDGNSQLCSITPVLKLDDLEIGKISKIKRGIILLEVALFSPYYPLSLDLDEKCKGLKFKSQDTIKSHIRIAADNLFLEPVIIDDFVKAYNDSKKALQGSFNNWAVGLFGGVLIAVSAAFFTPFVAGALASIFFPSLSGAAAVSAMLAALGGGAIAVGGAGMAGGFAVVVGGGALLGAGIGTGVNEGISQLLFKSPEAALNQAAKLEVTCKEICLKFDGRDLVRSIIKSLRSNILELKNQRDDYSDKMNTSKDDLDNIDKTIAILERLLSRLEKLL